MKLYNLGKVPWYESQIIYHALGYLGREALSLVSPATPYACVGFHQDVEQEVDMGFCRANNIPVFRREVGGGAVYLDGHQLFYQLILRKDNPLVPLKKEAFYRKFLEPVIRVYQRIGIPAEYKPINDLITGTRKISGTGAGEIGDCVVFVGNLIVDFNYEMMAKILMVPDEKFRDKIHKTMVDNLSTIRRELGEIEASLWDEPSLNALLVEEYEKMVGPMEPSDKDQALQSKMDDLATRMLSEEWLFQKGTRRRGREVKIRAGMNVVHKMHKAQGGLIRADYEVREGRLTNVRLSGDFFCYPEEAIEQLEAKLEGQPAEESIILVQQFYAKRNIDTPGISIQDWASLFK
ncbi:MAG: lipoate protein ligase C-terminal domain-containing protein [Desulfobacteraceae bacterium]